MKKLIGWADSHQHFVNIAFLSLVPIVCAFIMLAMNGISLEEVYLPNSESNGSSDELFYYKQVEGIVRYGKPLGIFGYNESSAKMGNLGAWSPALYVFWVLYGKVFGWNLLSPIRCNLFLLTSAIFLFGVLVKPDKKQTFWLALLYFSFQSITRFALSGFSEVTVYSLVIVWVGLYIYCERHMDKSIPAVISLLIVSVFLTIIRPYFAFLFAWLFSFLGAKREKGLRYPHFFVQF